MPGFGENAGEKESKGDARARQKSMASFWGSRRTASCGHSGISSGRGGAVTSRVMIFWRRRSASASGQCQNQKRADGPRRFVHGESEQTAGENA